MSIRELTASEINEVSGGYGTVVTEFAKMAAGVLAGEAFQSLKQDIQAYSQSSPTPDSAYGAAAQNWINAYYEWYYNQKE